MKYATIIVRTLIGLLFTISAVTYFLNVVPPPPEFAGDTKLFFDGLAASKYILPLAKVFELLCGLMFLSGRFVALAAVLIAPIMINIFLINAIHTPSGLPIVIPLVLGIMFLAYTEREKYAPLFEVK